MKRSEPAACVKRGRTSGLRPGCIRIRPATSPDASPKPVTRCDAPRRITAPARSAKSVSTTITTSRRADVQREIFRAQVELALDLGWPVIIHTREATDDTFQILRDAGDGRVRGVFHCFTGDEAMARSALEIDFYLSFAGIVTFPRADSIRAAARIAPAERLLAETDAPYLAPVPHRGKRNEPAYVAEVVAKLAEVRRCPPPIWTSRSAAISSRSLEV